MPRLPDIDRNTDDQIDFLVTQKYGALGFAAAYGQPDRMTGQQVSEYIAARTGNEKIAAYRAELSALPAKKLKLRVQEQLKLLRAKADREEANRWFNKPSAAADLKHWSACAYWAIDEGVALLLGKDPRQVRWDAVKSSIQISTVAKRFSEIRDLATRAHVAKIIGANTAPGVFLRWAERSGIEIPAELREAVASHGVVIADWQDAYAKERAKADEIDCQLSAMKTALAALAAERDALLLKLEGRPAGTWPWGDRETELLKHLAAAAGRFWKNYDPADATTAPRSSEVEEWLQNRSVSKRVAEVMAQILREDGLPVGKRR